MSKAIAFLAGLGVGHLDEKRRLEREAKDAEREARQRQREDTADARATELYDFNKNERQRTVDQRTALERAATPDAVVPEATLPATMDARDIGQPGEAPVPVTGFKVGASRFASQGLAQDAAMQQANQRVQQVMDVQDPAGRLKRQTEATQAKAAQVQLSAAEMQLKEAAGKAMKEGVLEALQAAAGGASPEQVAAIYNRNGEKKVAALKVEPFEFDHPTLGKQRSARISGTFDDGTPLQVQDAFSSSLDLFGAAKKFDLLGQWARDKTAKDDKAADNVRADAAEKRRSLHEGRMYAAALRTAQSAAQAAAQRANPQAAAPIWNDKADEFLLRHFGTKDEQTGATSLDGNGANFAKIVALAKSQQFGGDTMRAIADAIDQDNLLKQVAAKTAADSGGKIKPDEALRTLRADSINRLFNRVPEKKEEPPPPAAKPGVFAQMASRGVEAVRGAVGGARAEGAAYQAIDARVRQAMAGGPPLTPQELEQAKRFAIGVPN